MGPGGTHPTYMAWDMVGLHHVEIGDEVVTHEGVEMGAVTDIHGESFGDGVGDTITVLPAAVTLSTGDRWPVDQLVLLRRAGE